MRFSPLMASVSCADLEMTSTVRPMEALQG